MRRVYRNKYLCIIVLTSGLAISNNGQAGIAGTPHDLGSGICNYCHTPPVTAPPKVPAWNKQGVSNVEFAMYQSPEIAYPSGGQPRSVSLVCLSCHDGVTSRNMLLDNGRGHSRDGGRRGLFSVHPISISYNRSDNPDFYRADDRSVSGLPLYEAPGDKKSYDQIECASCHNPHDATNGTYLRVSNEGSAMCLDCHAL